MKRVLFPLLVILGMALAFSCQKAPFITINGSRNIPFTRDGGRQQLGFTCNRDWSITASDPSWVQVSPASGVAGDQEISVQITCAPNTTYEARNATLTLKVEELTETITITQETGLGLIVSPKSFDLSSAAQTIEVTVQQNVQYAVAIHQSCSDWIQQTKGLTTDKVTFTIGANDSYDAREGQITFMQLDGTLSETITVYQDQLDALFVTTPEYNLSDEAHTLSVEVRANVSFDVTSGADWIHYVETKGLKTSTITLQVDANNTYDVRTGKVTVKQRGGGESGEITVTQAQNYGVLVKPEEIHVNSAAQEVQVEVGYNVDYECIIPEAAKGWVSILPGTKGLATDVLTFAVKENKKYVGRETAIAFKQKGGDLSGTLKLVQAQTNYLSITPKADSLSYQGGSVTLSVTTNIDYVLVPVQGEDWIVLGDVTEKGTQEGLTTFQHTLSAPENEKTVARTAVIQVNSAQGETLQVFTLVQGPQPIVPFADAAFKAYCIENFDLDGDGELTAGEAARITKIAIYNKGIRSVKEIAYMPKLEVLDCGKNQITALDVSHNPALTKLDCYNNTVRSLDVSNNPLLKELGCYNTGLSSLDVSHNPALEKLSCGKNQLTILDVSYCPALVFLSCAENPYLKEIWLARGQTIETFNYDEKVAEVKYKD